MKKYLILSILSLITLTGFCTSFTTVVNPGTMTNLLIGFPQSVTINQIIISANTTNASALLVDTPTNSLTFSNNTYNVIASYGTNYINSWVDFYGRTNFTTNTSLIDYTNTVAASTNAYPIRVGIAALASTSTRYDQVNYYFNNGVWATNNSSGVATITIVWH